MSTLSILGITTRFDRGTDRESSTMRSTLMDNDLLPGFPGEGALSLKVYERHGDEIITGILSGENGVWYPIIDGVPRLLRGSFRASWDAFAHTHGLSQPEENGDAEGNHRDLDGQKQTNTTFSDKWRRFRNYGLEPSHQRFLFDWYCEKLGLGSVEELEAFYANRKRVLEVGPGSGFNARFIAEHCQGSVFAVDISDAALTCYENTADLSNCYALQADLMDLPFADESFDLIFADGVLHHTPSTRDAVRALYSKLAPGGEFFFYVYRQMGPLRRFSDQHIRSRFTALKPEDCYAACEALTELGRALSEVDAKVELDKPVDVLGIPAGTHDVQRLVYYSFVKCFWNDAFDFETNNMVNFDWYHPHHAWQHTEEEVTEWMNELGVAEFRFNRSNPNGICVLLRKPRN